MRTPEILKQNDIQIKGDHNIGEKFHLMGEYFDLRQDDNLPNQTFLPSPFTNQKQTYFTRSKLAEAQFTWVISPQMVNQVTGGRQCLRRESSLWMAWCTRISFRIFNRRCRTTAFCRNGCRLSRSPAAGPASASSSRCR